MEQAPNCRWYQFSLASLFWLTLFVATAVYAFREHRERVRLDEALVVRNSVTVGLSAPGVFGSGRAVPFFQDSDASSEAPQ